jgi:hypothetical protein
MVAVAKKEPAPVDTFAARKAELERQVHDICRGQEYAERFIDQHVKALRVALKVLNEQAAALELEAKQNG